MRPEDRLSMQVSNYLKMQYPNAIFIFDLSSGGVQSIGMAMRNKRLNKWGQMPDLFIAQPNKTYHGLFIELKAKDIYKKDGVTLLKNEHVYLQSQMINELRKRGYSAHFGIGFDNCKRIIDEYLK
jgi:hypothetical protein